MPGTTVSVYCDTSTGRSRPYVPAPLRLQVFRSIHELPHPGNGVASLRAFRVAGRAKGLSQLGTCLPVLPAFQSLPSRGDPVGRHYTAGSPLPAHTRAHTRTHTHTHKSLSHLPALPHRPRGAASDVSRLHVTASLQSTVSPVGQKSSPSQDL
jgi:hypothetical protein